MINELVLEASIRTQKHKGESNPSHTHTHKELKRPHQEKCGMSPLTHFGFVKYVHKLDILGVLKLKIF